jgi:hypothetical protein
VLRRLTLERDEEAVTVWKTEVWPDIKAPRATWAIIPSRDIPTRDRGDRWLRPGLAREMDLLRL